MVRQTEAKPLTPPYVAFATFKNMITGFGEHVLPSRIDRSVLSKFSGIVAGQLLTTLRFLGLIDAENAPTQPLADLVGSIGGDKWPNELAAVLKKSYAPIFNIDLEAASPSQFSEHFAATYPGEGSTQRKSMTFFLTAIQEAKIPISPYILKNKKPRSGSTKRRTVKGNGPKQDIKPEYTLPLGAAATSQKLSEKVLAILDKKDLKPDVEKAVYVLLKYLREEGK